MLKMNINIKYILCVITTYFILCNIIYKYIYTQIILKGDNEIE